ncbi:hypothetical protein RHE_CH02166 [Rhizobium etli CFN 42]|uniref:Uncharacterized protein n=2 Tax=Rhizobium etli TaxID=29449 RepID=Q2K888_RHIEC|nr:hypothetical protein [Rhizobium etli]ABC90948.1 hypothetical protein RHE_CH02166 [Rhizobium etli CFN 42]AGS21960.1 hypothetical protein REMIM1_CH02175 [Rhizobium etli bv. mimosae str. Mim1]ARQ10231.1 hypothetical protein NXC12_CH02209 [Rhizobium etli]
MGTTQVQRAPQVRFWAANESATSVYDNIEYISAPMEPQKITGVRIIPTTKILVTAKLRKFVHRENLLQRPRVWYRHEVRGRSDLGLSLDGALLQRPRRQVTAAMASAAAIAIAATAKAICFPE